MRSLFLAAALAAGASVPAHAQDAAAGERVFAQCRACHQVGETAKNASGRI
jgi:cytochrome c